MNKKQLNLLKQWADVMQKIVNECEESDEFDEVVEDLEWWNNTLDVNVSYIKDILEENEIEFDEIEDYVYGNYVCGDKTGTKFVDDREYIDNGLVCNTAPIYEATRCDSKEWAEKYFFSNWGYLKDEGYRIYKLDYVITPMEEE